MKTAIFSLKLWEEGEYMFNSDQDTRDTIKEIYEKRLKKLFPDYDFDVWVEDDEDYDNENETNNCELIVIRKGIIK